MWLYGPPGVGKSATGFELFSQLLQRGDRVAFIELDQIGMCMPAPLAARSAVKADNLLGMLEVFRASGVEGVVVSGDIAETMAELLTTVPRRPTLCRLRADDDVALERLTIRESLEWAMSSSAYESFDVPAGDIDITTHPLGVDEVAAEVARRLGAWPPRSATDHVAAARPPAAIDAPAVLVTGPRAVGTSMAAWQVLMASVASGHRTAYLDLEQLAFLPPALGASSLATTVANVATCWAGFRAQRADRLVLCGHLDGDGLGAVRDVLPSLVVVALTATPETLHERARRRQRHKDVWLPGDDLHGCDDDHLREVLLQAATFDADGADLVVSTDGISPEDLAARIAPRWPGVGTA